jgi:hypothetical protein
MFEIFKVCFSDTLDNFVMKILFYTGIFNWAIIIAAFLMNGNISLELIKKMRKLIFYASLLVGIPLIAALIKCFKN